MTTPSPIPTGVQHVVPHLVVKGATQAIEFYQSAFGATEIRRVPAPGGLLMHAELEINGARVYLCDEFPTTDPAEACADLKSPASLSGCTACFNIWTEDTDAACTRAEESGATVLMPPTDMFWGDRYAHLRDPFGHHWSFTTHIKDVPPEEMAQAAAACFGANS